MGGLSSSLVYMPVVMCASSVNCIGTNESLLMCLVLYREYDICNMQGDYCTLLFI